MRSKLVKAILITIIPIAIISAELYVFKTQDVSFASVSPFIAWLGLVWFIAKQEHITVKGLGFKTKIGTGFKEHALMTIFGFGIALLLALLLGRHVRESLFSNPHFQYGFIATAIVQQVVFIGIMLNLLKSEFSDSKLLIINALLFTSLHIFFDEPWINLPLVFAAGFYWSKLFMKHRNIYLLVASHAVLNFVFVMFSFISNDSIQF